MKENKMTNSNSIMYDMDTAIGINNSGEAITLSSSAGATILGSSNTSASTISISNNSSSSTITVDPSWYNTNYSWTTGYSYSTGDYTTVEDTVKKEIEKYLDSEDDMVPILKNYLRKYLERVMDNPDEIVKEIIKEKDEEINSLKEEVGMLKRDIADLKDLVRRIEQERSQVKDYGEWISTNPYITWIGGSDSTTYGVGGLEGNANNGSSTISSV